MNGKQFNLVEVIAHILKFLKTKLLEHLKRADHPLEATDFHWVITVPAIWKARGKQMMREAGYRVGTKLHNIQNRFIIDHNATISNNMPTLKSKLTPYFSKLLYRDIYC